MSWDVLRLVHLILVCLGTLKEYKTRLDIYDIKGSYHYNKDGDSDK